MNPYGIAPIQIISVLFSLFLLAFIVYSIRKKKLREEYAILWIVIFLVFLLISTFRGLIDKISNLLGILYQPASLFVILFAGLILLLLHFSLVISDLKKKINTLAMNMSILEEKLSTPKNNPIEKS